MTVPPDTQQQREAELDQELVVALAEALEGHIGFKSAERGEDVANTIAPVIAAIRRQAAADALSNKARSLDASARMFRELSEGRNRRGDHQSALIYASHAGQAASDAASLRREAEGIIAEGYEYECAGGCETPVPDAGDECVKCYAEGNDEDRWAE